jgi:hypothetical protein
MESVSLGEPRLRGTAVSLPLLPYSKTPSLRLAEIEDEDDDEDEYEVPKVRTLEIWRQAGTQQTKRVKERNYSLRAAPSPSNGYPPSSQSAMPPG